jgi:hypothetical protein
MSDRSVLARSFVSNSRHVGLCGLLLEARYPDTPKRKEAAVALSRWAPVRRASVISIGPPNTNGS